MSTATTQSDAASEQGSRLRADATRVLSLRRRIDALAPSDPRRVGGIVTVGPGGEAFLASTVSAVVWEIAAARRYADVLVCPDAGAACDRILADLGSLPGCEVIRLSMSAGRLNGRPRVVRDHAGGPYTLAPGGDGHRVFVVHQPAGSRSRGKTRMLADLVEALLLPSLTAGWQPPALLTLFDQESAFFVHHAGNDLPARFAVARRHLADCDGDPAAAGRAVVAEYFALRPEPIAPGRPDLRSAGLTRLMDGLDHSSGLDLIGALTRFCVFDVERQPDGALRRVPRLEAEISPMHLFYNHAVGRIPGCFCLPGGGVVGRFAPMLSLLAVAVGAYPDVYADDGLMTVLASAAGFRHRLADDVYITNRCAASDELEGEPPRPTWHEQFAAWYRGFDAVERLYGRHNAAAVLGPTAADFVAGSLAIFGQHLAETGDLKSALDLLARFRDCKWAYEEIRHLASLTA